MNAQPHIFNPGPATNLTGRAHTAYQALLAAPDGLRSSDLGRAIHVANGCDYCSDTVICKFAYATGQDVGKQLREKQVAIKRRNSGRWELMYPPRAPVDPDVDPFPQGF